ncbi:MAG: nucleotidyltransferase family protein [Anaerolineae bacterium]|nr:nucleotidyltransferase family protein [Anaerolineae bacterium]
MSAQKGLGINDLLSAKRDQILQLAREHGASNVRVFGSVARGEATADSDVDFLVEWDYSQISPWGGVGLILDLEDLLQRHVDISTPDTLHPRIKNRVLREAVLL